MRKFLNFKLPTKFRLLYDRNSVEILKIKLYWESGLTALQTWEGKHAFQHTDRSATERWSVFSHTEKVIYLPKAF